MVIKYGVAPAFPVVYWQLFFLIKNSLVENDEHPKVGLIYIMLAIIAFALFVYAYWIWRVILGEGSPSSDNKGRMVDQKTQSTGS